jgi:histidine ammonia-lyase
VTRVAIDGERLTLEHLYSVVFDGAAAEISPEARKRMNASRAVIERLVEADTAVYGVNTGFGKMASTRISRVEIRQLQTHRSRDARRDAKSRRSSGDSIARLRRRIG